MRDDRGENKPPKERNLHRRQVFIGRLQAAVLALLAAACGNNVSAPSSVSPPTPPHVVALSVTGTASLTDVGQTTQLNAIARLSDGATKDVTAETQWVSSDPAVITVSAGGVAAVVRLGTAVIYAHYSALSATYPITATPAGTFVIAGSVQEPGQGAIAGMTVTVSGTAYSTTTNQSGRFYLTGVPSNRAHLLFHKDGYEPVELDATPDAQIDARVQQTIRIAAGETWSAHRIAPFDLSYSVGNGQRCNSCRLVRIVVPTKGTLHIHVTWPSACVITLGLWIAGQHIVAAPDTFEINADVAVVPGETIVYVDRASPASTICHVPFDIATSLTN